MPHKHTRKEADKSTIDLPPTTVAKPLSVSKSSNSNGIFTADLNPKRANKKRKRNADLNDDTPKAFARIMAFKQGQKLPKSLDDGVRKPRAKKAKNNDKKDDTENDDGNEKAPTATVETPKIQPGEKMSEFSARVDALLPVGGLINKGAKGGKDPLGLKVGRTKTEKRMHRMYDEWREEEKKIQERRQEAAELAEEDDMEMDASGQMQWKSDINNTDSKGGKNKKKKKKVVGEVDDGNDDPWAQVVKNRGETKAGLHDVVQAPPTFTKVPKAKFKELGGAKVEVGDVPKASGSLRRREELGEVRKTIVESYRQMMKDNRTKMG